MAAEFAGLVADVRSLLQKEGAAAGTGKPKLQLAPEARMIKSQLDLFLGGKYIARVHRRDVLL
jgi:hypothetical protein